MAALGLCWPTQRQLPPWTIPQWRMPIRGVPPSQSKPRPMPRLHKQLTSRNWAQGVGAWGKLNSDGNAAEVSRNLGGFFTGFDRRFAHWRAGLALVATPIGPSA